MRTPLRAGEFFYGLIYHLSKRNQVNAMDKTTKTILIIIAAIVILCICTCSVMLVIGVYSLNRLGSWAEQSFNQDPRNAVRIGSEIADFEVPDGFTSPYGIHFGEVTLVGYKSRNELSTLFLGQFPEGTSINLEEMLKIIREGSGDPNSIWYNTNTTLLEQKSVQIRGQETTLNISEGLSLEGITYRFATATFQGRGGPSLVMISCPLDEWDIEVVETFIASIQ